MNIEVKHILVFLFLDEHFLSVVTFLHS
jgi:hypothetical protein